MNSHLELVQKLNNNQVVDLEEVKNMFELEEVDRTHYKESNMMEYVFNSNNEYIDSMRIDISDTDNPSRDDIIDNEEGVLKFIRESNRELFDLLFNGGYINIQKLNK